MLVVVILLVLAIGAMAFDDWRARRNARHTTSQERLAAGWSVEAAEEADDKFFERQQALSDARCKAVEAQTQSALAQFELAKANMEILVDVDGGVVQGITNIPLGVTVKVRDYDTDGGDSDELETDADGDAFSSCVYTREEA